MTDDERAIRELIATWMSASKARDIDTVLGLMTDDVVFMVPGREPFGKQEFAAASKGMKDIRLEGRSEIRELEVLGNWAYLRSYLEVEITPPGGNAVKHAGYTLTIMRKEKKPGRGEPVFDKIKADLAKALFSLPAVLGVEYGIGFGCATMRGSAHNDVFVAGAVTDHDVPSISTIGIPSAFGGGAGGT